MEKQLITAKPNLIIIGVDEVGRGPLAGPIVSVASCFLYNNFYALDNKLANIKITDSKKLSKIQRKKVCQHLIKLKLNQSDELSFIYQKAALTNQKIDEIDNIHKANLQAISLACELLITKNLAKFRNKEILILVDGKFAPNDLLSKPIIKNLNCSLMPVIKGDSLSQTIAASSIIAKVIRDQYMSRLDLKFPEFNWAKNSGYPTKHHKLMISKYGLTNFHRLSFANLKNITTRYSNY